MKRISLLALTGLQLVAGLPQTHEHPTTTSTTAASTSSGPAPTGAAPEGCKLLASDSTWPAASEWSAALPGIHSRETEEGITRPDYHFAAKNSTQVQAAVKFAAEKNIRITILNSGHDFLGRNDAPSGLAVDVTALTGINVLESFTASTSGATSPSGEVNVIKPVAGKQAAVTFGAGVSTQVLNDALDKSGLFTMGAAHGSVKTAGGYGQSGGHGPLTSKYGLAVDQVLEYKVVTADGKLVVANKAANTDLFWALRGGGGSTFGVVVEATVKAYPSPKITIINWWVNATDKATPGQGFWDSAAYLHSQFPTVNAKGAQGYYYVYPDAMKGIFLHAEAEAGQDNVKSLWAPVLEKLGSYTGMQTPTSKVTDYNTYKEFFDTHFGALCPEEEEGGHDHRRRKRHEEGMTEAMGIVPMDSRLLGQKHLTSTDLAATLKAAMPSVPDGQLRGHLVAGGKVLTPDDDTSVNPAWRKAYVHLIGTGRGAIQTDVLRTLAPEMGAYSNEASTKNPNWKTDFWGTNYEKLSTIKTKYDPSNVFWATPGINADALEAKDGRLCKSTAASGSAAPANDNQNIAKAPEGNEDNTSPFPGTESPDGGHNHGGTCGEPEVEIPEGFIIEPDLDVSKPALTAGATLTKVRYGPYAVEAMGMITNRPKLNIQKPCTNCYLVAIQAGLEYENGTVANVNTGGWLHHMVLVNNGRSKKDLVCGGALGLTPQRIYASGNERSVSRTNGVAKYGIRIDDDRLGIIVDLMNESNEAQTYYLTLTWETIPISSTAAAGYKAVDMAWLDITDCGTSSVPAQEGVFELMSKNGWKSTLNGRLLFATGHVHDGGMDTTIYLNGKPVCVSQQLYGRKPGFVSPEPEEGHEDDGGHSHGGVHISDAGVCKDFATVKVGDLLTIGAHYNTTAFPLSGGHDGEPHDIMGISRVYIGT